MADLLVREVRIVPVGGGGAPSELVDVRVRHGRVTEVAPGLREDGALVVHADGRWLMPGLWDQHVHMTQWARTLGRLDLSGTGSPHEVLQRVAAGVPAQGSGVLVGYGYRSGTWTEGASVAALDAVVGERAVVLISGDAHNGWLSSAALRLLGAPPTEGPLTEYDWFAVLSRLEQLPGAGSDDRAALATAVSRASALGVVGVTDLEFGGCWADWPQRFAEGLRSLRVRAATYAETLEDVVGRGLRTGAPLEHGHGLLTMGPLKVISDGSLNTRTAYCCDPYDTPEDDVAAGQPSRRGALNLAPEDLTDLLRRARAHGLEAAVHAIGDAAVATALDAFAASGARGTIEHAQLVAQADIARMASVGVAASVQPAHLFDDREVTHLLWPDRADRCFPLRSLLAAGVPLALGSDAPVSPLDPWLSMAAAVHRSADENEPWNPAEAISPAEALAASTDGQGTVRPGSRGDLVLLDEDPLAPAPDTATAAARLRRARVALTVVDGRPTYDAR